MHSAGAEPPAESHAAPKSAEKPLTGKPFVPAIPMEQAALTLPEERVTETGRAAPWRIAGEVLKTYIVCEDEEQTVWLIDKHAAHERVNFDRLMAATEPPMRQTLLRPAAAELSREDSPCCWKTWSFGISGLCLRGLWRRRGAGAGSPADLDAADVTATLEELAEKPAHGPQPHGKRQNLLHTIACKAAIKAGWDSDESELRVLVDKVQSGEIQYCPHGRPVKVKLSKYELEKMFKRA